MTDEKLKDWVEKKLERGVDPERLKESLEDTGHDPSVVDEVQNPFGSADVEESPFEEKESIHEADSSHNRSEKDVSGTSEQETDLSEDRDQGYTGFSEQDSENDSEEESGLSFPSVSIPSLSIPSFSVPSVSVGWKKVVPVLLVFLVAGAGMMFVSGDENVQSPESEEPGQSLLDSECPDVGVRIESASVENGQTVADVLVTRGTANVVLEVYANGNIVGSSSKEVGGTSSITVDATGDRAVFRAVGCTTFSDEMSLN